MQHLLFLAPLLAAVLAQSGLCQSGSGGSLRYPDGVGALDEVYQLPVGGCEPVIPGSGCEALTGDCAVARDCGTCVPATCRGNFLCNGAGGCGCRFDCDFLVRGYYLNDQRVQWSGREATFGVEGVVRPVIVRRYDDWTTKVLGEFYINQPFDRNVLTDTAERRSYVGNFDVETFEISQLLLSVRNGDLEIVLGKMVTPFGRTYFPMYTNAWLDAPFIRTESILWRETGLLVRWDPGIFVGDLAITNGCEDRDTNSSKALVSRIGIETDRFALGCSVKVQDGIGSERQKLIKNHVGVDFMVRRGPFTLSGEVIYDEYGFRQPGFDPINITWGRSIYYRDLNNGLYLPITGVGYYLNLGYDQGPWCASVNYGEFYPEQIGHPQHDVVNRRGIVKVAYALTPHLQTYTVAMFENGGYIAQSDVARRGFFLAAGLEYAF